MGPATASNPVELLRVRVLFPPGVSDETRERLTRGFDALFAAMDA